MQLSSFRDAQKDSFKLLQVEYSDGLYTIIHGIK